MADFTQSKARRLGDLRFLFLNENQYLFTTNQRVKLFDAAEFIARLYQSSLTVKRERFRDWAIQLLREAVHFDAALWCRVDFSTATVRSITLSLLPESYAAAFTRMRRHNPLYVSALDNAGKVFTLADVYPVRKIRETTQIHQRLLAQFGMRQQLGVGYVGANPGTFSYFELYRTQAGQQFNTVDKTRMALLAPHLSEAATHAFFIQASKPGAPYWHAATGLCDEDGNLYECQAALARLLAHHFPGWKGARLPFALPPMSSTGTIAVDRLSIYVEPRSELFLVRAWETNPLDGLSPRELEVALAAARGAPYKEIGRRLALSDSTVANHMYRAYRKLGINRRTQLADLISVHQG